MPENMSLLELAFWGYLEEDEKWQMIPTYIPKEQTNTICGKTELLTKFVLAQKK